MVPLIIAGAALSAAGTIWGNQAKADQEAQNAWFYRKQAEYAKAAGKRELELATIDNARTKSGQISALTKGGADIGSGSAANLLAMTAARGLETLEAIQLKTELDYTLAISRSKASQDQADTYGSVGYNLLTGFAAAAPGLTQAYSSYKGGGTG